ncbi:MAG: FAD-dependent oxidoreductase [Deltaproteobacteria bacterium]|nr:FAD-dependent oxidoreductase [Deltaproteobacteria bacterium]
MGAAYSKLMSPGRIGRLELRNRIIVTSMGVCLAEDDGSAGDRIVAYHEEQARGGAGLVLMGVTGVAWPVGAVIPNQLAISDDRFLPGLRRVAKAVHAHGAKIAAQLHHGGLVAGYAALDGHPLWAPSPPKATSAEFVAYFLREELAAFAGGSMPRVNVLEKSNIALVASQFGAAARRAREAGFDGCEVHGGHGYLISSFLSPSSNTRTDEYGGSLENRARFMLEVVAAIRAAVGADFPLWMKLDSAEHGKAVGTTLEDALAVAGMLERAGVDAITVTSYHDTAQPKLHSGSNIPHQPELNIPNASAIKARVRIPVIASGRVEPERADALIAAGAFDLLAMGRKLLADPQLPNKLAAGKPEEIRPCIYCYTCVSNIYLRKPTRCAVNPALGFDHLQTRAAAPKGKRFVVIGAGPAGMEAARRLDAEGNRVVLLERSDRLGGTLRFASLSYEANERLLAWLERELARSRVEVRLRTEATPELLRTLAPDEVVVATGAVRALPPIPGAEQDHVLSGDDLRALMLGESSDALKRKTGLATRLATRVGAATGVTASPELVRRATRQWMPLGKRIAILGGELVGLELAEFLAERGRSVTVIEESAQLGRWLSVVLRMRLIPELREHGVALFAGTKDLRIAADAVSFTASDGAAQRVAADHVIVAQGARGDSSFAASLRAAGFVVREAGDCTGVGYLEGAMRGAARAVLGTAAVPPL